MVIERFGPSAATASVLPPLTVTLTDTGDLVCSCGHSDVGFWAHVVNRLVQWSLVGVAFRLPQKPKEQTLDMHKGDDVLRFGASNARRTSGTRGWPRAGPAQG